MTAKDLKNALLQEAVQGKLVPQIASEGNASDLLEEIRKERLSHGFANSYGICDGKNKKSKKSDLRSKSQITVTKKELPEITEDEIPFEIPENWCWCRLGELITFIGGYAYDSHSFIENSDYQVLRLGNVKNGYLQLSAKPVYINAELAEKTNAFKCIPNDILVTMTGTRLKRDYFFTTLITENDKNLYVNQRVGCLRPKKNIYAKFLTWILKSKPILDYIFEFETGTANQGNLGSENIKKIPIPLPPLAEQKRIVAAIEKFMPLIEEYGKKESALKAINEQIGALTKKAILQEAVQGKLVPQIAAEGNAKDLLEEIRKEKLSHGFANSYGICDGKDKKSKSSDLRSKSQIRVIKKELPEITEDEIPFDIPENWCWCRLGEISIFNGGYAFKSENYVSQTNGVRVLRISDFDENGIKEKDPVYYPYNSEMENYKLSVNDIIICMTGGTVGKSYLVKNLNEEMYVNQRVADLKCSNLVEIDYIYSVILSYHIQSSIQHNKNSTNDNISADLIKKFLIPLPPLAEQKRIVAAIEKLLPLCEKLGE